MKLSLFLLLCSFSLSLFATSTKETYLDQHYGSHERQIFDLWLPKTKKKAPLVIYIHGGGFVKGSKDEMRKHTNFIEKYNKAGIALAAINYRFLTHTALQTIMREDIAGFIQFMRLHAKKYNLDKRYFMPYGISAGGSSSLWLATHDDIADEDSLDPKKRESSRVFAAGHLNAQVSYDYMVWYKYFGKLNTDRFMGDQVFSRYHLKSYEDLFSEEGEAIREDLNMYGNLTEDDCPIIFWNNLEDNETLDNNHFVHSPKHTRILGAKAEQLGIETEIKIKADGTANNDPHTPVYEFFMKQLKNRKKR